MVTTVAERYQRQRRWLRRAGLILAAYGLLEVVDCLSLVLMQLGIIENFYPTSIFEPFDRLLKTEPIQLLPFFLFYASLRLSAAAGVLRNRRWGWWLALIVSTATILPMPFLLPFSGLEALLNVAIVAMLVYASSGEQPVVPETG